MKRKNLAITMACGALALLSNNVYATDAPEKRAVAEAALAQASALQTIAPYTSDVVTLAQHAYQRAQSPAIQTQLQQVRGFTTTAAATAQNPEIATAGSVLIFISFSMPETSLRQWFAQAQRLQAPLIIRGLVNNSFTQTSAKIATLAADSQSGVVLEPRLFVDYHITHVPAVVVRNTTLTCPSTQNCPHVYPFDVVTGDVGLDDALTTIADQPDSVTQNVARAALHKLGET